MARRLAAVAIVLLCLAQTGLAGSKDPASGHPASVRPAFGQSTQDRPLQADGIVRLLLDLEAALASGREADFRALATTEITERAIRRFEAAVRGGGARPIIRERTRRADGNSFDVVAEVLISRGQLGRVATWLIVAAPGATPGQFLIADLREMAAVDGLLKLQLDVKRQFAVKNLTINAPDLTFRMASGSAFMAESPNGITAVVFRGKADVNFAPTDSAEQGQLRIFNGRPALAVQVDTAFLRINPAEFVLRVSNESLTPVTLNPVDAQRAQQVFDDMVPKTYSIDLRTLTPERWSLEPTYGSFVLEFKTNRYGWLTYARSPSEHEDINVFDRDDQRNLSLYSSAENQKRRNRSYSDDDGATFDIDHQRLDLTFDPARLWVSGRASVRLTITASAASTLNIKLAQPLAVASVSSPMLGELLFLRIIGQNTILVGLPDFVERGSTIVLDVVYGGRLDSQALDREAIQVQSNRQETQEPQLIITPEARYLYSNRVPWYPQGGTTDHATAELRLSVPSEYQVVATGSLLRSTVVPNNDPGRSGSKSIRVVEYLADRPVRYLACIISRFVPIGRTKVEVPGLAPPTVQRPGAAIEATAVIDLDVVATSRMTGRNRQTTQRVAGMLASFARLSGGAPYPDFTLAALDENLPGGHSPAYFAVFHQPLATTPYSWSGDPVAFDDTYQHFFLAHEVAHQWWGQAVGWKNYHEQWLSEGLAQYFAALYAAEDRGPEMLETLVAGMRKSTEPFLQQGPIYLGYRLGHIRADGRVFRAVVYNKSAVVLHMLRRLIGDDAFFKGVKGFYREWRFKKAGTDDLKSAFEAETPMKLDRFFDQWIRGFSRPRLTLAWQNLDASSVVRVTQTGEVFDLPLTVQIQFVDGRVETRTLKISEQVHEERVGAPIRRVTVEDKMSLYEIAR